MYDIDMYDGVFNKKHLMFILLNLIQFPETSKIIMFFEI